MQIEDVIKLSKSDLQNQDLDHLEKVWWEFYPHEISWAEVPPEAKAALVKIGRVLVQNAKLKHQYMPRAERRNCGQAN